MATKFAVTTGVGRNKTVQVGSLDEPSKLQEDCVVPLGAVEVPQSIFDQAKTDQEKRVAVLRAIAGKDPKGKALRKALGSVEGAAASLDAWVESGREDDLTGAQRVSLGEDVLPGDRDARYGRVYPGVALGEKPRDLTKMEKRMKEAAVKLSRPAAKLDFLAMPKAEQDRVRTRLDRFTQGFDQLDGLRVAEPVGSLEETLPVGMAVRALNGFLADTGIAGRIHLRTKTIERLADYMGGKVLELEIKSPAAQAAEERAEAAEDASGPEAA